MNIFTLQGKDGKEAGINPFKSHFSFIFIVLAIPSKTTAVDVDVVVSDDTILDVEKSKKKDTLTEVDDARRTSSNVQMLRQVSVKRPTGFDRFTIKKKVKATLLQKFENLAPNLAV